MRDTIRRQLPNNRVQVGWLAVTVKYPDETEIQLLPAIRTKTGGVRIAQHGTNRWSKVVHPEKFAERLAEVNAKKDGRVVPIIKLAKAMAGLLHHAREQEDQRLPHGVPSNRCVHRLSRPA